MAGTELMEKEHREKQDCCRVFRRGGSFICAGDLLLLCLHSPIRQGSVIIILAVPTDLGSLPTAIQQHQHRNPGSLFPSQLLEGSW